MSDAPGDRGLRLLARSAGPEGHRLTFEVTAGSPFFAGHFPGRPILPGVAHLALVARGLSELAGRRVGLAEVRTLKLRRPVGPGERIELRIEPASPEGGPVRFEIRGESGPASHGVVIASGG
jgi:3-hydroxyacyl-[acyl-carrier-protein] dehydratase